MSLWSKRLLFLFYAPFILFIIGVETSHAEHLLSVYHDAEKSDPLLAAAQAKLDADDASRSLARSALLPRLSTDANLARKKAHITGLNPVTIDESYWGDQYSVTLVQPIFNGQAYVELKSAKNRIQMAKAAIMSARQDLILRVCRAYFGLLQAEADNRVAEREKGVLEEMLAQVQAFLKNGTGDIIAVQEALARLDAAEAVRIKTAGAMAISRCELQILTHRPVGALCDVAPFEPVGPQPDRIDLWLQSALANQPILIQAHRQLEIANDKIRIAQRERWPRLDLKSDASYNNGNFIPDMISKNLEAGLVLSFPLYLGGSIGAKTRQASAEARVSRHVLDNLEDRTTLQTKTAFQRLNDSVAHLLATRQAMKSAQTSMEATQKGYSVGARTNIDALDAIHNYYLMRHGYFLALYNHLLARVELKAAAGVLSVKDVAAINSMLTATDQQDKGIEYGQEKNP